MKQNYIVLEYTKKEVKYEKINWYFDFFLSCNGHGLCHNTACPVYTPNENCRLVSFKPGLEPRGFNGIKWETELSTLTGDEILQKRPEPWRHPFLFKSGRWVQIKKWEADTHSIWFLEGESFILEWS